MPGADDPRRRSGQKDLRALKCFSCYPRGEPFLECDDQPCGRAPGCQGGGEYHRQPQGQL
eukprot:scaffold649848_cov55-Prasinocladus_malaysianus.AAC.1